MKTRPMTNRVEPLLNEIRGRARLGRLGLLVFVTRMSVFGVGTLFFTVASFVFG